MVDKYKEIKTLVNLRSSEIIPILEFLDKTTFKLVLLKIRNSKLFQIMKNKTRYWVVNKDARSVDTLKINLILQKHAVKFAL